MIQTFKKKRTIYLIIESNPKCGYQKVIFISGNGKIAENELEKFRAKNINFEYNPVILQERYYSGRYDWA